MLMAVISGRFGAFVLEQPRQSLMIRHPGMRCLVKNTTASRLQRFVCACFSVLAHWAFRFIVALGG